MPSYRYVQVDLDRGATGSAGGRGRPRRRETEASRGDACWGGDAAGTRARGGRRCREAKGEDARSASSSAGRSSAAALAWDARKRGCRWRGGGDGEGRARPERGGPEAVVGVEAELGERAGEDAAEREEERGAAAGEAVRWVAEESRRGGGAWGRRSLREAAVERRSRKAAARPWRQCTRGKVRGRSLQVGPGRDEGRWGCASRVCGG